MAKTFNILGQIQLRGPTNLRSVTRNIQQQLNGISTNVNVNIASGTQQRLNALNTNLQRVDASLRSITASARNANQAIVNLSSALAALRQNNQAINVNIKPLNNTAKAANSAAREVALFGEQAALAARRFVAFAAPTSIVFGLISAIKEGVSESIEFEKEMIRLSQVTGRSVAALSDLKGEITRLSVGLGVSSKELGNVATTLAQAGLNAKDTKAALEALARSSLAATFSDIESTTEGAIATFQQFNVEASSLINVVGSLNAVSAQFAVESDDLVSVIRRTGGAFKASGGNLNELLALFSSVRSTTRESADSIATGFRTIFTRIQRPRTIQYLKELGIELSNVEGEFVGPFEAVRRLNAALSTIQGNDPRFAAVVEELGGFRQVSKVIPLIQQFGEAERALTVAIEGQNSIIEDSEIAQKSLGNQIAKVREEFLALFRELSEDKSFRATMELGLDLAKAFIDVARALKPLLPLFAGFAAVQLTRGASSFAGGFLGGLTRTGQKKFAKGGLVPGSGNGDTVPALLTPGEFVLRKDAVESIGMGKLARMNKFAKGGPVREFAVAALQPTGLRLPIEKNVKYETTNAKGEKVEKSQAVRITAGGLTKAFAKKEEKHIERSITGLVVNLSKQLETQVGATEQNYSKVPGTLRKSGFYSTVGQIFESALSTAGAPYDEKTATNAPIDFPKGLGSVASRFGLSPDVPTDATRTFGKKGKTLSKFTGQVSRYLRNEALVKSGKPIPNSGGSVGGDLQSQYNNASPQDKAALQALVSKNRRPNPALAKRMFNKQTGINLTELRALKFAKGGQAKGEDTVPAMLTPGEFVVNKDAASKIGLNNLKKLNQADKVQKFAKGGAVGGSGLSGQGTAIGLLAISSLLPSFLGLDDATEGLTRNLSAAAVAALTFGSVIKGTANQQKLGLLSRFGTSPLGGAQVGAKTFGNAGSKAIGALARNFTLVANGSAALAAAFTILGQSMQDNAAKMAAEANTRAELDSALKSNSNGSIIGGAGTGAGIGAAIGSVLPGVGTILGAVLGTAIGGLVGAFSAGNDKLIKAFNQAQFDKSFENLNTSLEELTSGSRVSNAQTFSDIGRNAGDINSQIITAEGEQRKEFIKQYKGSITSLRQFSDIIEGKANNIDEFLSQFDGAGDSVVNALSVLTNKSLPEVKKQIEAEIKARKDAADAAVQVAALARVSENATIAIKTLNNALVDAADKLSALSPAIDTIIANAEGNGGFKFQGGAGFGSGVFGRAATGGVVDNANLNSAVKQLGTGFIDEALPGFQDKALSLATLTRELPGIISRVGSQTGVGEDKDRAEEALDRQLDSLSGVNEELIRTVKARFSSELASRESSGESGFLKEIRSDLPGFVDKLVTEADKGIFKEADEAAKLFTDQINFVADQLSKRAKIEGDLTRRRLDVAKAGFELERFGLRERQFNLDQIDKQAKKEQSIQLQGTGLGGGASATQIGAELSKTIAEIEKAQTEAQNSFAKDAFSKTQDLFALQDKATRLRGALDALATSSTRLNEVQKLLTIEENNRAKSRSLVENTLYGSGKDRVEFNRSTRALAAVGQGDATLLDLPKQLRDSVLNLIDQLPDERELAIFGGKTKQDFRDDQLNKGLRQRGDLEGVSPDIAKELFSVLTEGTDKELELRKAMIAAMQEQVTAQTETNRIIQEQRDKLDASINTVVTTAASNIVKAIAQSTSARLQTAISGTQLDLGGVNDSISSIRKIEDQLRNAGTNLTGDAAVKRAKELQNNSGLLEKVGSSRKSLLELGTNFGSAGNTQIASANAINATKGLSGSISASGGKLDESQLRTLLFKQLSEGSLGGLFSNPEDRTAAIDKIIGSTSSIPGFGTGIKGKIQGGKDVFSGGISQNTVDKIIESSISEVVQSAANKRIKTQTETLVDSEGKLKQRGFSQGEINTFSNTDSLKALNTEVEKVGESLDSLTQKFVKLNAELFQLQADKIKADNTAAGLASGGVVGGKQINSAFTAFVPKGTDRVPAMLTKGEFVVNRDAAAANLPTLKAMNYAKGGSVGFGIDSVDSYRGRKTKRYSRSLSGRFREGYDLMFAGGEDINDPKGLFEMRGRGVDKLRGSFRSDRDDARRGRVQSAADSYAATIEKMSPGDIVRKAMEGDKVAKNIAIRRGLMISDEAAARRKASTDAYIASRKPQATATPASTPSKPKTIDSLLGNQGQQQAKELLNRYNASQRAKELAKNDGGSDDLYAPTPSASAPQSRRVGSSVSISTLRAGVEISKSQRLAAQKAIARRSRLGRGVGKNMLATARGDGESIQKSLDARAAKYQAQREAAKKLAEISKVNRAKALANKGKGVFGPTAGTLIRGKELLAANKKMFGFNSGGPVPGSGSHDNVPALLTPGEFVLNKRASKALGMSTLSNFNNRFASGGQVKANGGGGSGGVLSLDSEAMSLLNQFSGSFTDAAGQFQGTIGRFSESSASLSNALSNWSSTANKLAEAMLSMPTEITMTHAPININHNFVGLEGFEQAIVEKIMARVNDSLGQQQTKAADGKAPFFAR